METRLKEAMEALVAVANSHGYSVTTRSRLPYDHPEVVITGIMQDINFLTRDYSYTMHQPIQIVVIDNYNITDEQGICILAHEVGHVVNDGIGGGKEMGLSQEIGHPTKKLITIEQNAHNWGREFLTKYDLAGRVFDEQERESMDSYINARNEYLAKRR